jgi:hypothetical protein
VSQMNNDNRETQIERLERFQNQRHPALSNQFSQLERGSARASMSVVSLLVLSVALLAIGLATLSLVAFGIGVAAFITSFLVDRLYECSLTNHRPRGRIRFDAPTRSHSATTSSSLLAALRSYSSRRPPRFPDQSYPKDGGTSCMWIYRRRQRSARCFR